MPRCACRLALAAIAAVIVLSACGQTAQAQTARRFPQNALRGEFQVVQPPDLLLNGQAARLAPGARIRGADNLQQMSAALVGNRLLVHYTVDPLGLVLNVWVLTPEEAARRPWPESPEQAQRWEFDAAAQTWTKR